MCIRDRAFADAGIDLADLDSPEGKTQLSDILLYHVYAGTVLSTDITEGMTLQMVNGKNATFTLSPSIDGANITGADVVTSNGIIHVIDAVIIPQAEVDPTTTGDGVESEEEDSNIVLIASIIGIVLIVLIIGGLLYSRGREESSLTEEKDFSSNGLAATPQPASTYSYEPQQSTYTSQYAPQQSQPLQPVQVQPVQTQVAQPVAQVQATQPIVEAQQTQAITQTQASCFHFSFIEDKLPPVEASKISRRSFWSLGRITWASGSPKRTLNSTTLGPSLVIISPV